MAADKNIAIVIHGGAGTIQRDQLSAAQEQGIRQDLQAALDAGYAVLDQGGDATQGVIAAIKVLQEAEQVSLSCDFE